MTAPHDSRSLSPLRPGTDVKPSSLTPEGCERARRLLMRRDPVLGAAIRRIGPRGMAERQRTDHLTALVGAIVSQHSILEDRR
jgi:hypothetical protein